MSTASTEMWGTARLVIREGKLEEVKRLVAEAMEIVRTKDTGTIEYAVFINAEGTECFVHERYRDSAAGLEHSANISSLMQKFMEACTITGEVCGNPSPELRKALEAGGVKLYTPLQSLTDAG
jgi:quinol monooxygenase YgiN